jgi:hypothetical protein
MCDQIDLKHQVDRGANENFRSRLGSFRSARGYGDNKSEAEKTAFDVEIPLHDAAEPRDGVWNPTHGVQNTTRGV